MRISLTTLGCKLNQAETNEISDKLKKLGHFIVPFRNPADVAVIRACAVTQNASQATRGHIRRAKRGGAFVVASGCLENRDMPEIDYVAETPGDIIRKINVIARSHDMRRGDEAINDKMILSPCGGSPEGRRSRLRGGRATPPSGTRNDSLAAKRTRAFIKIQDGCKFNCAYCVVPRYRGKSKSVPVKEIIKKIIRAEKDGCHEVILTGVNICQYSSPSPSATTLSRGDSPSAQGGQAGRGRHFDLAGLIKKILSDTKIERIRLGSLDPRLISDELIALYGNPLFHLPLGKGETTNGQLLEIHSRSCRGQALDKREAARLMPHWHLSLQSGSDSVLTGMNRRYTTKQYKNITDKLRRLNPLFSITTDIIVGFPGETENEFLETIALVRKIKFAKVHVFPYSPRPMTAAASMKNMIQDKIKTGRVARLIKVADKTGQEYARKIIGKIRPVLFESIKNNKWTGHSPEYLTIIYRTNKNLKNAIVPLKIKKENLKTGA